MADNGVEFGSREECLNYEEYIKRKGKGKIEKIDMDDYAKCDHSDRLFIVAVSLNQLIDKANEE
jgi:hypothetical protein